MSAGPLQISLRGVRAHATSRGRASDRVWDATLHALCILAALLCVAILLAIVYEVLSTASLAIGRFGIGFLAHTTWQPNFHVYGAGVMLFGTAVTSAIALTIAIPLSVAIALFLSTVAPGRLRAVIGPLVEMLAAIPSVILGFWGILVLCPFMAKDLEPFLHAAFGFLPIFGEPESAGASVLAAGLVVAIMVVPIVASIARDLFLTVPGELQDGATALGATRWEVIRGVILPSTASGLVAASFLGLGRALGEAIAVTQVVGAGNGIHASLFKTGDTLASRIAAQYFDATTKMQVSALFYLAALLLGIGLIANLGAQLIVRRFDAHRAVAR